VTLARVVRVAAGLLRSHDDGFTLTELLVVMAITLSLMSALFGLAQPAQGIFDAQPELADMHQRLRVGVDVLAHDLLMANPPVMPYRIGQRQSDPERGVFFRPDTISVLSVPWDGATVESHTYYLRRDQAAGEFQLRHYDGASTDRPVVDHVVYLNFEYFGAGQVSLGQARLEDGPWYPDITDSHRFDADLLNIRLVRVTIRVQAASAALRGPAGVLFAHGGTAVSRDRYLPDREIRFDVTPRNLDHE
jgi:prepilin-type N-terminal cleavage/methylation domain-containing protein